MAVELTVVKGAMQALAAGSATGLLESLGMLPDDLKLVMGNTSWRNNERNMVIRNLDTLMYGTMDVLGLPRFMVPAEYVAATIAMFVHPCNLMVACMWMESGQQSADAMGNPNSQSTNIQGVAASQLFALCIQLVNDGTVTKCRNQFEMRTNHAIREALNQGETNADEKIIKSVKKTQ